MIRSGALGGVRISWLLIAGLLLQNACGSDDPSGPSEILTLSSESVTFTAEPGGSDPESQPVQVTAAGSGTITDLTSAITYGTNQPNNWLNASLSQSTTPSTLTVTPTTGGLQPGNYTATVAIAGRGAANSPRNVAVTFRIASFSGYPIQFAQTTTLSPNFLLAEQVTVPANAVLASANVILNSPVDAGTDIKVGLYTDAAGSPGTLIASTASAVATIGRNELPFSPAGPIAAGNYWFALITDTEVGIRFSITTSVTFKLAPHTFANAIPATYPTSTSQSGYALNFFLKTYTP